MGVGDELDRPVAGDQRPEELERAQLDVNAAGGQHHAVLLVCPRVGDLVVERLPLGEELAEAVLPLRERTAGAGNPAPRLRDVDLERHGQRVLGKERPGPLGEDGAAAQRQHSGSSPRELVGGDPFLEGAELCFTRTGEELGNGRAGAALDLGVEIDEPASKAFGHRGTDCALPRAHEPDERKMAV